MKKYIELNNKNNQSNKPKRIITFEELSLYKKLDEVRWTPEEKKVKEKLEKLLRWSENIEQNEVVAWHKFKYWNDLAYYLGLNPVSSEKEKFVKEWEELFEKEENNDKQTNQNVKIGDVDEKLWKAMEIFENVNKDLEKFYDKNEEIFEEGQVSLDKFSVNDVPTDILNQDLFQKLSYDKKYFVTFLYNYFDDEFLRKILKTDVYLWIDLVLSVYTEFSATIPNKIEDVIEQIYKLEKNGKYYEEFLQKVKEKFNLKKEQLLKEIFEKEAELERLKTEKNLLDKIG